MLHLFFLNYVMSRSADGQKLLKAKRNSNLPGTGTPGRHYRREKAAHGAI